MQAKLLEPKFPLLGQAAQMSEEEAFKYFVDVAANESRPLYKKEAFKRSE